MKMKWNWNENEMKMTLKWNENEMSMKWKWRIMRWNSFGLAYGRPDDRFEAVPQSCYSTGSAETIDLDRPKYFMRLMKSNVLLHICSIYVLGSAHEKFDVWSRFYISILT